MMPPIVRIFIVIMIRFPGAMLWILGMLAAIGDLSLLLIGFVGPKYWPVFLALLVLAFIGHLMREFACNMLGDVEYRIAGSGLCQLLAWDLAIGVQGIVVASAGIALAPCLLIGDWRRTALVMVLFVGLAYLLVLTNRSRAAFLNRCLQEPAHGPMPLS